LLRAFLMEGGRAGLPDADGAAFAPQYGCLGGRQGRQGYNGRLVEFISKALDHP